MFKYLLFSLLIGTSAVRADIGIERSIASIKPTFRNDQARELLGSRYNKSVVSNFADNKVLTRNIFASVKQNLPKKYKNKAQEIARTIVLEAARHELDPYFVMAVISGESSFNPDAKGPVGELGLMQLRMTTGEWMATKSKSKWKGEATLLDPVKNIKLGTAYLAWLRTKFNGHGQLYVAAYNMGPGSVKNAVEKNVWPKDYPKHVMKRYIAYYREL